MLRELLEGRGDLLSDSARLCAGTARQPCMGLFRASDVVSSNGSSTPASISRNLKVELSFRVAGLRTNYCVMAAMRTSVRESSRLSTLAVAAMARIYF